MDWLFDNLETIIPLVIVLIYILSALRGARGGEAEERDVDAERRAAEMQEEIRRKILERQRKAQQRQGEAERRPQRQPQPAQKPVFEEPGFHEANKDSRLRPDHRDPRAMSASQGNASATSYEDQIAEQRRQIDDKMRQARELKQKADSMGVKEPRTPDRYHPIDDLNRLRKQVRQDLHNPHSLKRAILLKEILDRPVGRRDEIEGHNF